MGATQIGRQKTRVVAGVLLLDYHLWEIQKIIGVFD
jgi:hypothetical protein